MNILVIEDNELKYKQIEASLNRILKTPNIVWMNSRNSGLASFMIKNKRMKQEPYHLVITDNYLPLNSVDEDNMFEGKTDTEPFAKDIVDEIRRLGFEQIPIIVCSSEEVEECDCNYKIKYDSSVALDSTFKTIFMDLKAYIAATDTSLKSLAEEKILSDDSSQEERGALKMLMKKQIKKV